MFLGEYRHICINSSIGIKRKDKEGAVHDKKDQVIFKHILV